MDNVFIYFPKIFIIVGIYNCYSFIFGSEFSVSINEVLFQSIFIMKLQI